MAAGGIGIVVVGVGTGLLDRGGLLVIDEAQADADLDLGVLVLDLADHPVDAIDLTIAGAVTRGHQADAAGPSADAGFDCCVYGAGIGPGVLHDLRL
ncbi:hypothetical protein SDC9_169483 [bioreactor metagenome]|uniref:Uncharacterized protein n=1 Tax=bioreactor metagenome TaxID=1076179 RepID=A0A645G7Y5_9ZZZZ